MGALKTSEQGDVVVGEGQKDPTADDRPVDSGAKIVIGPGPIAPLPQKAQAPRPSAPMPTVESRTGVWLVILVYIVSAAALGWAIYDRFLAS